MAAPGNESSASSNHGHDARRRDIAAGKRPASPVDLTPTEPPQHQENPQPGLDNIEAAFAMVHSSRNVRQRLFADLYEAIQAAQTEPATPMPLEPQPGLQHHTITPVPIAGPAMPTPQFQDLLNGPWFSSQPAPAETPSSFAPPSDRSFLRMFQRPLKPFLPLPRGFGDTLREELFPTVYLTGDTGLPHLITVHDINGRLYFTDGWEGFVLAERLLPEDLGLFVLTGPRAMTMKLYARSGLEKPITSRPVGVDPDADPPVGANVHVPSHILAMEFELAPRVTVNPAIIQEMANVWSTRRTNNPLYVCAVLASHINKGSLCLGSRFSAMMPPSYRLPAAIFFGDSSEFVRGTITRPPKEHELARLSSGFTTLVRNHGIVVDDILIIRIRHADGGYRVRVFKVPQ